MKIEFINRLTIEARVKTNSDALTKFRRLIIDRAYNGYRDLKVEYLDTNFDREFVVNALKNEDGIPHVEIKPYGMLPNHRQFDSLIVRW